MCLPCPHQVWVDVGKYNNVDIQNLVKMLAEIQQELLRTAFAKNIRSSTSL